MLRILEETKKNVADCRGNVSVHYMTVFVYSFTSYSLIIFGEAVSYSPLFIYRFRLHRNDAHGWVWEYNPPDKLSKER